MTRAALLVFAFSTSAALADVPRVVTDIPPVHSLAASVMGDLGKPKLLLWQGADAHDYQMRPSDAQALADADAVFWIGPEMTPWLDRALQGDNPGRAIALLAAPGTQAMAFAEGGTDPHAFLDPGNATLWLVLIADHLAALDPANAAAYRANAEAEAAHIAAADAEIAARLGPVAHRPIIVFHEAFGYFAAHFGLTVAGSVSLGDAADPGAARLSSIREQLSDVACIFPESGHDPKQTALLAEGTPARIGRPLDPEGRDLQPGPDLYTTLLTNLGVAITDCLAAP
jgi:zinc transport system substrate-binding protein